MRVLITGVALAITTSQMAWAGTISQKEADRIKEAATVLSEIHSAPDKDIPQELWERGRPDGVGPSARATWMSCRSERGGGGVFQERPDRGRWLVDDR